MLFLLLHALMEQIRTSREYALLSRIRVFGPFFSDFTQTNAILLRYLHKKMVSGASVVDTCLLFLWCHTFETENLSSCITWFHDPHLDREGNTELTSLRTEDVRNQYSVVRSSL